MSPAEIQQIVEEALRNGVDFPWWAYALTIFGAGVSAYFGTYLSKSGEAKATRESFDAIRAQLKRTTTDTEEIKAALSTSVWRAQQHWSMREKYYTTLLEHLKILELSLQDRAELFEPPGTPYNPDFVESDYFTALTNKGSEAYQRIRELIGPGAIFLSSQTIQALETLVRDHWHVAEDAAHLKEYLDEACGLVSVALKAVLDEARADLDEKRTNA